MNEQIRDEVLARLENAYSDTAIALIHNNPFELLISTILSAQCTDRQVNKVTPRLFSKYPTPEHFAALTPEVLGDEIRSCGFYHTKSRNIIQACRMILAQYGGEVPRELDELVKLPGVGRKTANVVISNAFGKDAIAVDTHVFRVANRLGLASANNVKDTEMQLMSNIPREKWSHAHHWLIFHGRRVCTARRPLCTSCFLQTLCRFGIERLNE